MPERRIDDEALLATLARLFRDHGVEGVSLSRISAAAGLQRASLYHRFPGGKREMVLAVLRHGHERFGAEVLAPLHGEGSPRSRVRRAVRGLDAFYEGGARPCFLDTLSVGERAPEVSDALAGALEACVDAFRAVAREAGRGAADARRLGQEAVLRIQGALVLSRVTGEPRPFRRVLRELPDLLCEPEEGA